MTAHNAPAGILPMAIGPYLRRAYPMMPEGALRTALKRRDVRINGAKCGPEARVCACDCVALYVKPEYLTGPVTPLFHDGELLAVEKPPGLPVDADEWGIGEDTLIARVRRDWPDARLCHRLDTGTGGALVLALTAAMHARVLKAFRDRTVQKMYQCLVRGTPQPPEATLKGFLLKDAHASAVRMTDGRTPGALPIKTHYRTLASEAGLSRLEVRLVTGRTHQIRAHMAHIGHPLIGDDKYGDRALNHRLNARHPALWCVRIELFGHVIESVPRLGELCRADGEGADMSLR